MRNAGTGPAFGESCGLRQTTRPVCLGYYASFTLPSFPDALSIRST